MEKFKYLGSAPSKDGLMEVETLERTLKGRHIQRIMKGRQDTPALQRVSQMVQQNVPG